MNIVVTIKQVPDTTDVRLDPATGVLQRDRAKGMTNPEDKYALEMAIGLKEKLGGKVSVLSLGPETAKDSLKEALAMGADEAYLVTDAAAKGSDAVTTAQVLAAAIDQIGPCDLILTGRRSIDGWTGAVAPMLAEALKLPLVSAVRKLDVNASQFVAEQDWDASVRVVESSLPAVASVTREAKAPRLATAMGIMKAAKKPMTTWSLADLGLSAASVGLAGSTTKVVRVSAPERKKRVQVFEGASAGTISELNQKLAGRGLL
ncbi:MAG TPA: electron transfer flavoprotein subunit beta/FixA family protein [Stenomitos sp.]